MCDLASNTMFKLLSFSHLFYNNLSVCLSVCLSVRFFVGATGHSFGPISAVNGFNDVVSQPIVLFDGRINIAPY